VGFCPQRLIMGIGHVTRVKAVASQCAR
jgi:hypothetical protein